MIRCEICGGEMHEPNDVCHGRMQIETAITIMTIELKPNNTPTEPGWYLCRCDRYGDPEIVWVWEHKGELRCTTPNWSAIVADCNPRMLWSDRIEITPPGDVRR